MSATTIRLLQAASQIAGGDDALARRLDVSGALLAKFMDGTRVLPDALLLRAVDIILADRQVRVPLVAPPSRAPAGE